MFDSEEKTYILSVENGRTICEGIGCSKFEYSMKTMK